MDAEPDAPYCGCDPDEGDDPPDLPDEGGAWVLPGVARVVGQ